MGLIRHNTLSSLLEKGPRAGLSQTWLICGEPFLVRKAFDQVTGFFLRGQSKKFGLDTLDGRQTPVGDVIEQVTTFSFLQSAKVIALKDAPLFTARVAPGEVAYSSKDIDLVAGLAQKGIPEGHILIITSAAPDKRKKIYKTILEHGTVVDCTVATGARKADLEEQQGVLRELARQQLSGTGKQMDTPAFNALVEQTGFNPELFSGSIEKLLSYTGTRNRITMDDVAAVVHRDKKDPIFSLTNAVMDRDIPRAITLVNALFSEGFHPLQILKTFENQIRKLVAIKLFLSELHQENPELPPVKTMHFNGFKQVMMPRIQARDKAAAEADKTLEAIFKPEANSGKGKKAKPSANDLLLAPNPKSAYPVFQNFHKSEHFSLNELIGAMMMLSDLDMKLKTSAVQAEVAIEFFIMTLCRKKGGGLEP